jgi:hypothetical protein
MLAWACSTASHTAAPDSGADAGFDANADGDASVLGDTAPSPAQVRIAQLSPDAPPLDVCLAPHGTGNFGGALFAEIENDTGAPLDASPRGLSFAQVSAYLMVPPGNYDLRVVPGGSTSCSTPLLLPSGETVPDAVDIPALAVGAAATIVVAGDASVVGTDAVIEATMILDDASLSSGAAALRAFNAVPSVPTLDFGFGSSAGDWSALLTNIAFGDPSRQAAPSQGMTDANGYLAVGPFTGKTVSVRPSGAMTDTAVADNASVAPGSLASFFAVGGKTGDTSHPPLLLLCTDNAPTGGIYADCAVAQ